AARVAAEYHALAPETEGTTVETPIAMVYDYDSIWATRIQPGFAGNTVHDAMRRYYGALFRAGVNVDMVRPRQDLSGYRVLFAPGLFVLPDDVAEMLVAFVRSGGILLTDCRAAVKDGAGLCHERTLPGLLGEVLGIRIEEYEALAEGLVFGLDGREGFPGGFTASAAADWVTPVTAEVLAGYDHWHLRDFAALSRNRFGAGRGYYVGTVVKEPAFYDALVAEVLAAAGHCPVVRPPAGVEVSVRSGRGRRLLFLINHTDRPQSVAVPAGSEDLLRGGRPGGDLDLEPFGVAVLKLPGTE
ncbi:MAG: beta-galactosidase trimerization domain-containing protein, partial [Lentisphaeria bacterium]|nr:beta-galactosidase trimerization domain-containing protein [Lentisphaeria bacterium]